ncbi:hypothetical protein [Streptomyces sp. NBC_01530]|uniref:hypothetical protein n=1 Tax=Streptomyces sp. NBC_01530 TaxID=2903895 RepID=UPI0038638BD2
MNATMHVRLPKGVLRSLRLDTPDPWHTLEHTQWLRTGPGNTANEVAAELLDAAVLGQAPARPDRTQAADWALRVTAPSTPRQATGPLPRLAGLYLTAHTDLATGTGLTVLDQMARACGTQSAQLPNVLDQLATTGPLKSWQACRDTGDLHWTLAGRKSSWTLLVVSDKASL